MKLRVNNIKQPISEGDELLPNRIANLLGLEAGQVSSARITRRALDARKKQDVHFLLSAVAEVENAAAKRLLARENSHVEAYSEPVEAALAAGTAALRGREIDVLIDRRAGRDDGRHPDREVEPPRGRLSEGVELVDAGFGIEDVGGRDHVGIGGRVRLGLRLVVLAVCLRSFCCRCSFGLGFGRRSDHVLGEST